MILINISLLLTSLQTKYIYRRIFDQKDSSPYPVSLKDGDEIMFGKGPDAEMLGKGPTPILCNLQLAVARVLKTSGAADGILQ